MAADGSIQSGDQQAQEVDAQGVYLPVRSGLGQERRVPLQHGQTLVVILEIIAKERGCTIEELIIIREGVFEPLDPYQVIDADYPHHKRHHVHHRTEVMVEVFYGAGSKHHGFKRHATVKDVLEWALSIFPIDAAMAPEFELALHGTTTELPGTEHIGHLAGHHHAVALDLVRGAVVNGARDDR